MGWRSSALIVILIFGVLFSALYLSKLASNPVRIEQEGGGGSAQIIHPKISQVQASGIVLTDIKKQHPEVNDLLLYFNSYNFSTSEYQKHPDSYRGYQYSFVKDVKQHPELLQLRTVYFHPNGTKYYVNPVNGSLIKAADPSSFLWSYCLQQDIINNNNKNCDRGIYSLFSNRVVYMVDAGTQPNVGLASSLTWVDADTGQIIEGNTDFDPSRPPLLPPNLKIYGSESSSSDLPRTIKEIEAANVRKGLNNPQKTFEIEIMRGAAQNKSVAPFNFNPVVVQLGDNNKVKWTNYDYVPHTITSDYEYFTLVNNNSKFDSGPIQPTFSYEHLFTEAGRYPYHCKIHPWMKGLIWVTEGFN